MRRLSSLVPVLLSLTMVLAAGSAAHALGLQAPASGATPLVDSSFTYQGQLKGPGGPVTAVCDFRFTLWDHPTAGAQVGAQDSRSGVTVAAGVFTVVLNTSGQFGSNAFNGEARWLAISVQCPGDLIYTALNPRQPLTATPYALSLRPGAVVSGNSGGPSLSLLNPGGVAASIDGDLVKVYGAEPQRALPIAFGMVSFTGTLKSGTANVSVVTSNAGYDHFEVTIAGEDYNINDYVTVVTPVVGCYGAPKTASNTGKLWVLFEGETGYESFCSFGFVTYKP
jgi:hypothetical protein